MDDAKKFEFFRPTLRGESRVPRMLPLKIDNRKIIIRRVPAKHWLAVIFGLNWLSLGLGSCGRF